MNKVFAIKNDPRRVKNLSKDFQDGCKSKNKPFSSKRLCLMCVLMRRCSTFPSPVQLLIRWALWSETGSEWYLEHAASELESHQRRHLLQLLATAVHPYRLHHACTRCRQEGCSVQSYQLPTRMHQGHLVWAHPWWWVLEGHCWCAHCGVPACW